LGAAAAIEEAMVRAIAESERSIVAIARTSSQNEPSRDVRAEIFPQFGQPAGAQFENRAQDPTSPDFIPNEYATGVIIDAQGLVLTNAHVITPGSDFYITTIDRKVYRAEVKAADARSDLAVLRVIDDTAGSKFTPIKFGNAKKLRKGQIVIALGNPYAIARDGQPSACWGIISNLGRKLGPKPPAPDRETLHHFGTLIQTDAKLNLGTSGGALLNLKGEMVGLTTSLAATSGYEQAAGYAIPIDDAFLRIIDMLKQGREVSYGFLGIEPINLRQEESLQGLVGMRVKDVSPGTPARHAGLQPFDIITHVNGEPIYDAAGLRLSIGRLPPGSVASLAIERAGQRFVRPVSLSKGPNPGEKIVTDHGTSWRGLRVDSPTSFFPRLTLTDDLDDSAVAVTEVAEGSPAYRANLHRGMIITHVGSTPVHGPDDFYRQVASRDDEVSLWVSLAPGHTQSITVPAE
jgi:S1-C subfamily serine protease